MLLSMLFPSLPPCPAELNPHDTPYGFYHIPLPGYKDGYPVFINNNVPWQRLAQLIAFLRDGSYLHEALTRQLTAEMIMWVDVCMQAHAPLTSTSTCAAWL